MNIKLYNHQEIDTNECFNQLKEHNKIVFQASTGYGKGVVIPWVAKYSGYGKALVLCHREVLVDQLVDSMALLGMTSEKVIQTTKKLHHKSDCYVGMVESVVNRLNKDKDYFKDIGILICDEAHRKEFLKAFPFFPNAKIVGFTATPVWLERETYWKCNYCRSEYNHNKECCGCETAEWSRPLTMSRYYNSIVVGHGISYLIENGFLVQDISICKVFDDSSLTIKGGEFTTDSLDAVFDSQDAKYDVVKHYEEYALDKKTIIFNSSIKANKHLLDEFIKAGYTNVKLDDSKSKEEPSKEIIQWFKDTPNAILLNVDKYTAGMDVTDIECVILNRATLSLSLFLQCVGRGGRSTKLIPKDHFYLIDLGGNVARHLEWSDESRDWEKIFYEGIGEDKAKKQVLDQVTDCPECGMIYQRTTKVCPECGFTEEKPPLIKTDDEISDIVLQPLRKTPPPNGEAIYKYVKHIDKNINYALNSVLVNKIVDMFITHKVTSKTINNTINNGMFEKRVGDLIRKAYFVLIKKEDIIPENWQGRTIDTLIERVKVKLKKKYNIE